MRAIISTRPREIPDGKARECAEAGLTPTEIAAIYGVSRQTVHAQLNRDGYKRPPTIKLERLSDASLDRVAERRWKSARKAIACID